MLSPSAPASPGRPLLRRGDASPDGSDRQDQRIFLGVNALPLAIGVVLSCSATLTGVRVYGLLTLGVAWGGLQFCVFLAGVWWYEARSSGRDDPAEHTPVAGPLHTGAAGAPSARESGR